MAKPYLLKPTFDRKHNKWRLNLPAQISPSGKRERHLFANIMRHSPKRTNSETFLHDFGRSINMLPANRLVEAIECWQKLMSFWAEAPSGALRRISFGVQGNQRSPKSITLGALFDSYAGSSSDHRSENYVKAIPLVERLSRFLARDEG